MARQEKIAIVDDDIAVLESTTFLLEVMGHHVVSYKSALEFLEKRDIDHIAGLILDHHMPQMTGLDLAARLRADGSPIPILLITGAPSPTIVARAADLAIVKVLEKPPSEEDLLSFIDSI